MEKYLEMNEEVATGGNPYTFHSSLPALPCLHRTRSITQHKPLFPPYHNQTTTSLISHPSLFSPTAHTMNFKLPKTEPEREPEPEESINFMEIDQVPNLYSFEQEEDTLENHSKLVTQSPFLLNSPQLPYNNNQLFSEIQSTPLKYLRQRETSRQRRHRIREKIQCLKNLLPSEKKMDTATVLENAYNYIKFLETQVSVLDAMPPEDCLLTTNYSFNSINGGGLVMMSRNRVLQIMVNSPVTQRILTSQGLCVYSIEQLVQMIGLLFTTDEAFLILNSLLFSSFTPL